MGTTHDLIFVPHSIRHAFANARSYLTHRNECGLLCPVDDTEDCTCGFPDAYKAMRVALGDLDDDAAESA